METKERLKNKFSSNRIGKTRQSRVVKAELGEKMLKSRCWTKEFSVCLETLSDKRRL